MARDTQAPPRSNPQANRPQAGARPHGRRYGVIHIAGWAHTQGFPIDGGDVMTPERVTRRRPPRRHDGVSLKAVDSRPGRLLTRVAGTGIPAFPGFCPASARAWQNYPVRFTDRLSQPQKIVVVVAFGIALATAGNYFLSLGNFGWYAYAP